MNQHIIIFSKNSSLSTSVFFVNALLPFPLTQKLTKKKYYKKKKISKYFLTFWGKITFLRKNFPNLKKTLWTFQTLLNPKVFLDFTHHHCNCFIKSNWRYFICIIIDGVFEKSYGLSFGLGLNFHSFNYWDLKVRFVNSTLRLCTLFTYLKHNFIFMLWFEIKIFLYKVHFKICNIISFGFSTSVSTI